MRCGGSHLATPFASRFYYRSGDQRPCQPIYIRGARFGRLLLILSRVVIGNERDNEVRVEISSPDSVASPQLSHLLFVIVGQDF